MGKHTIDPQISAEHLAGAVRFATVSNADNSLTTIQNLTHSMNI